MYDLWYEQKENIIRTYTDEMPDMIPLVNNKEFKSIKNAVIKEALKLNLTEDEIEETRIQTKNLSQISLNMKKTPLPNQPLIQTEVLCILIIQLKPTATVL